MRALLGILVFQLIAGVSFAKPPHIVLVMADDLGYGQAGYYHHPVLKTPNLDAMAANGLRFDRFYAGASNCSPTRATVLTGRSNDRTGVANHGFALHRQERTIAAALRDAGYATGHFGKWHLNGVRGPGVPILKDDGHHPGHFGFEHWFSVTNYFDMDPILSRMGKFEEKKGDSSEVVVAEALEFIKKESAAGRATFSVIWYGTPHSPFRASEADTAGFSELDQASREHYGELVAMDRSIGALRRGLREIGIADDTLVWFNSDNGGLPKIKPGTVGELRGFKNSLYEGGLRVPAVIEWPAKISPRVTRHPACTMDIFQTLVEVAGLDGKVALQPQDGVSLKPLFEKEIGPRKKPIPFRHDHRVAWIDNDFKLVKAKAKGEFELYNLERDPSEKNDLSGEMGDRVAAMRAALEEWSAAVDQSAAGKDYPEGKLAEGYPLRRFWGEMPEYRPFFEEWKDRPEYKKWVERYSKSGSKKKKK